MNVLEFQRGWFRKQYGIAIILTPSGPDALAAEMPPAKAAIRQWADRRGKGGRSVRFSVLAGPDLLDSYEEILRRFCSEDAEAAAALKGRKVVIDFGDRRGKKSLRLVELKTT